MGPQQWHTLYCGGGCPLRPVDGLAGATQPAGAVSEWHDGKVVAAECSRLQWSRGETRCRASVLASLLFCFYWLFQQTWEVPGSARGSEHFTRIKSCVLIMFVLGFLPRSTMIPCILTGTFRFQKHLKCFFSLLSNQLCLYKSTPCKQADKCASISTVSA